MKSRLTIVIAAALLSPGCEKQEESKPARVVQPATADRNTRRVAPVPDLPAPADEPAVPTEPPSPEEVETLLTGLKNLAEEVKKLPADAAQVPNADELEKSYSALMQRRNGLLARMDGEQKANLAREVAPLAKVIGPPIMRLRLAKARERVKALQPANPGSPKADPSLEDLIRGGSSAPSATPPPPAKRQTAPPQ